MSCVVRWWDVLFVKGMHFSSKNARLLNLIPTNRGSYKRNGSGFGKLVKPQSG